MKHARVRLTAHGREEEIHPMYDVMANAEFVERATALQWNFTGDELSMFHYVEGDAGAFETVVSDFPEVLGHELVPAGTDAFYVYVRCTTTDLLREMFRPLTLGGIVVVPPIVYHADGTVTFSIFGPDEELQAAVELGSGPVEVTVERVSGLEATTPAVETGLTDRQREAVEAGLELGYYDVPRTATHEDVAGELGCAPSTAAEHLRKAESVLLRSTVGTWR